MPSFATGVRPQATGPASGLRVALWIDTFTASFAPAVAVAASEVLAAAGLRVLVVPGSPCCALTWITTGQLGVARRILRRTLDVLAPAVAAGLPIVGLEPSCTSTLRADLPGLLAADPRAASVAAATVTLAEALERYAPGWNPPRPVEVPGGRVVSQVHCHQHAVLGFGAERRLLDRLGVDHAVLDAGCCGLAGSFGFEREHHKVSVAVAEQGLLPALRAVGPGATVLADGFSCRTQITHLTGRQAVHMAELLRPAAAPNQAGV